MVAFAPQGTFKEDEVGTMVVVQTSQVGRKLVVHHIRPWDHAVFFRDGRIVAQLVGVVPQLLSGI